MEKAIRRGVWGESKASSSKLTNTFTLPDILGNAGGVTVSYFEWVQGLQNYTWTLEEINNRLHQTLTDAFRRTMLRVRRESIDMRIAALIEGIDRTSQAKLARGLFP